MTGRTPQEGSNKEAAIARFARERGGSAPSDEGDAAEFETVSRLWDDLEDLRSDPSILAMREAALAQHAPWRAVWRSPILRRTAMAGLALLCVTGGLWTVVRTGSKPAQQAVVHQFNTRIGQISGVALPDGSLAVLDTGTTIRFRNGKRNERRVDLVGGRALFEVAKMPDRPFKVVIGETALTALGTKFDVLRTADGFNVNLVEGKLRVTRETAGDEDALAQEQQLVMLAGDRLTVTPGRWLLARGLAEGSVDWAKGQLVFDNARVVDVVTMLNRYTNRKLRVTDPGLAAQRISAVIRTDDPLMLIDALTAMGIGEGRIVGNDVELVPL